MNEVIINIKVILLNTYYGYPGTRHTHNTHANQSQKAAITQHRLTFKLRDYT